MLLQRKNLYTAMAEPAIETVEEKRVLFHLPSFQSFETSSSAERPQESIVGKFALLSEFLWFKSLV